MKRLSSGAWPPPGPEASAGVCSDDGLVGPPPCAASLQLACQLVQRPAPREALELGAAVSLVSEG